MTEEQKPATRIIFPDSKQQNDEPVQFVYSGMQGAKTIFSNHAEITDMLDNVLIRFFHQRPIKKNPAIGFHTTEDGKTSVLFGNHDTLEVSMQCGIALTPQAADFLYQQLTQMMAKRAKDMLRATRPEEDTAKARKENDI